MKQKKQNKKDTIFNEMKEHFKRIGLPVMNKVSGKVHAQCFETELKLIDIFTMRIYAIYSSPTKVLTVGTQFSHGIPTQKIGAVDTLVDLINQKLQGNYLEREPHKGSVILYNSYIVNGDTLDIDKFNSLTKSIIRDSRIVFPRIIDQVQRKVKPKTLYTKFCKQYSKVI